MTKLLSATTIALTLLVATGQTALPVYAMEPVANPSCDQQAYVKSMNVSTKASMLRIRINGVSLKVPYSAKWKIGSTKVPRVESYPNTKETTFFGGVYPAPMEPCADERTYSMTVTQGTSYKPSYSPYQARVEKIGTNVVTIFTVTGDTDCGGESAILLKGNKVIEFKKMCSGLDAEAKSIIASIR